MIAPTVQGLVLCRRHGLPLALPAWAVALVALPPGGDDQVVGPAGPRLLLLGQAPVAVEQVEVMSEEAAVLPVPALLRGLATRLGLLGFVSVGGALRPLMERLDAEGASR